LAGFRGGSVVFRVCAAERWIAQFLGLSIFSGGAAGSGCGNLDGLIGAAFGSFLLLGLAKAYKQRAAVKAWGMGDVK